MHKKTIISLTVLALGLIFLAASHVQAEDGVFSAYQPTYTYQTSDTIEVSAAETTVEASLPADRDGVDITTPDRTVEGRPVGSDEPVITLSPVDGVIYHFPPEDSEEDGVLRRPDDMYYHPGDLIDISDTDSDTDVAEEIDPERPVIEVGDRNLGELHPDIPHLPDPPDVDTDTDDGYADDDAAYDDNLVDDKDNYSDDESDVGRPSDDTANADCDTEDCAAADHEVYVSYADLPDDTADAVADWEAYQGAGGCSITTTGGGSGLFAGLLLALGLIPLFGRRSTENK